MRLRFSAATVAAMLATGLAQGQSELDPRLGPFALVNDVRVTNDVAVRKLADESYYCELSWIQQSVSRVDSACPEVPAGRLLALQYITAIASAVGAAKPLMVGVRADPKTTQGIVVPLRFEFTDADNREFRIASQAIHFYVPAATTPFVYATRADAFLPASSISVRLVGRLFPQ